MKREVKIWGERWLIRQDTTHAVSYLKVKAGYRCSWHCHKTKYNLFVVLAGVLELVVEELGERRDVRLSEGQSMTIKPGQWHEFRGVVDCSCVEEMYVEYDEGDIDRKVIGSKIMVDNISHT